MSSSSTLEAEFTFGSKNVYTVTLNPGGTFTASTKAGDITFSYDHNMNTYGHRKEFAYKNNNDNEQDFTSRLRNLGQDALEEKLRRLIKKAPASKISTPAPAKKAPAKKRKPTV
jgi:hypothetical protein